MYSKRTGLVLGFHGCDKSVRDKVVSIAGGILKPSYNEYDWLGHHTFLLRKNNVGFISHLFLLPAFTSADWDPLGEDCGSNKNCLKRTEMYKLECTESITIQCKQIKAFFCCSNQAISG